MKRTFLLIVLFLTSMLPMAAQTGVPASGFADPQSAVKANAREDELYSSATSALDEGNYDKAISSFDQVARMKGRRADGALFWKAYALNKAGRRNEVVATVAELRKNYPQSSWLRDAHMAEFEATDKTIDPASSNNEDEKEYALRALINLPSEKALPILEKFLQGNSSLRLKEKALFVLTQINSEKAQQLLLSIAKGSSQPELQAKAIQALAVGGGRGNSQTLREIYAGATSPQVKKQVLRSFIITGDKEGLMTILRQETSPELKREAIRQLGPMGARQELRQLYKETTDAESKESLLQGMGVAGDAQGLIDIAKTEADPKIRSRAIRNVGVFGGQAASEALGSIYAVHTDVETKKEVIRALFVNGAAKEMVGLARKETNPELKKELVRNLALMHSADATDYMMELLNK